MRSDPHLMADLERRKVVKALLGSAALLGAGTSMAQTAWKPAKQPVRLVVHWPAGGPVDVPSRYIAHVLGEQGINTIVENRPGATGSVGSEFVYNSPPDGTTLLVATSDALSLFPHLGPVRYDPMKFEPILSLGNFPMSIVARTDLPANSIREFVQLAKTQQLTYVTAGVGSAPHITACEFARVTGIIPPLHVPTQGGSSAMTQAVGGKQVDFAVTTPGVPLTNRDRMKILGISGKNRLAVAQDIPTFQEEGVPLVILSWMGLIAPPGMAPDLKASIAETISKIVATDEFRKKLDFMALDYPSGSPSDFAATYRTEYQRWGELIKVNNIKLG